MKIGASTIHFMKYCIVDAIIEVAKYTDHIQISPIYREVSKEELNKIKEIKENYDLYYYIHGLFPNHGIDPKDKGYILDYVRETFENAYFLESEIVILHPAPTTDNVKEVIKISEEYGIPVAFEILPDKGFLRNIKNILEFEYGICVDTAHLFIICKDTTLMCKIIELIKDKILCFHIADAKAYEDLQVLPGYGEINWYKLSRVLRRFKVPMLLESVFPENIGEGIKNIRSLLLEK